MNNKNIVGNGSKATLPGGQNLSDKIQENKTKQTLNNINNSNVNKTGSIDNNVDKQNEQSTNNKKSDTTNSVKSKADNVAKNIGSEALKKSLKAAFPYIPQFIINKLVDSNLGQEVIEKQLNNTKRKIIFAAIGIAGTLLMWMFLIVMLYTLFSGPISFISDTVNGAGNFFKRVGNWFSGRGWCTTEEDCQSKSEYKYYKKLDAAVEKYSGNCIINPDLITATIFYGQMVSEKEISLDDDATKTTYFNYLDVSEAFGSQSATSQINKLVKVFFKGESGADDTDDENLPDIDACYFSSQAYRRYLIDTYIGWAYPSIINENRTKEQIADEILTMGNVSLIKRAFSSSIYCPSIAVEQENGDIETMDLETYVARVVTKENNWYEGDNIENMKAQAVASRTYALNATNNCQNSIKNSQSAQTLADTPSAMAIRAAEETNSLVLLQDGKVFSTMYDALAIDHSDNSNYYLKQANLAIPKSWLDSKVTKSQYEFYAKYNHGKGMSQWGSRYLQTIGKNYEDILNTFYTMAEISRMGGLISGGNYSSDTIPAADKTELAERRDYYISIGMDYIYTEKSGLVSQCPWYAKSRALEIVYYSNMDEELKATAMNSLRATNGNGNRFAGNTDSTIFTHSYDCRAVMPGSIVSWDTTEHPYGHVAIVEKINDDGTILISDGWNRAGANATNNWNNVTISARNVTADYMCKHGSYTFVSYAYLLG